MHLQGENIDSDEEVISTAHAMSLTKPGQLASLASQSTQRADQRPDFQDTAASRVQEPPPSDIAAARALTESAAINFGANIPVAEPQLVMSTLPAITGEVHYDHAQR